MNPACPCCAETKNSLVFRARDYEHGIPGEWSIVECANCGLYFQSPIPQQEELTHFYPKTYSAYNNKGVIGWLFNLTYKLDAIRVRALLGKTGRILDIGCGDGLALSKIRDYGDYQLCGVEFDEGAAEKARARGLDVRTGEIGASGFELNSFDLIRMGHVIEHLREPAQTVSEIYKLLKPGGVFIGETPNSDCLDFRLFRRYWGALHLPRHLTFFNHENLCSLLKAVGFTEVSIQPRLRTAGWSCGIQNFLADRAGLQIPASGRVSWYVLLIFPFLPITALQALFGKTGTMSFLAIKSL